MGSSAITSSPAITEAIDWQVAHAIPGRLRVRYPPAWWKAHGAILATRLRATPGVRAVDARAVTGSVAITYDARRLSSDAMLGALLGLSPRLAGVPMPSGTTTAAAITPVSPATSWLELGAVAAALAGALAPVGAPARVGFTLAASVPAFLRAARTTAASRRLTGDGIEALAHALLAGRGQHAAAAALVCSRALGDWVLRRTERRVRRSLRHVVVPPGRAVWRVSGPGRARVSVADLAPGDVVVVGGGAWMPVDGVVVDGEAFVDQRTMTGESLPVERRAGDRVYAGTTVEDGEVEIRAERVGGETALGRIVAHVESATTAPSEIQRFAQRLADVQAPRSIVLALTGAAVSLDINAGLAILLADYGMAARVGIPVALLSANAAAARRGVLIKGARTLEQLARVDAVVFDKTGTLTSGTPRIDRVVTYAGWNETEVLRIAAAAERGFRHPVARALRRLARERDLELPARGPTMLVAGLGVDVRIENARVLVGNARFLGSRGVDVSGAADDAAHAHAAGRSASLVAVDGRLVGLLTMTDELRPDAADLLDALRTRAMRRLVMLTGDHIEPTRSVARSLGLKDYHAGLLPEDKARLIRVLKERGHVVAMVGDGVNDALALAQADVGIAVRADPDVVAEAAGVVLLRGGLAGVVRALDFATDALREVRKTVRTAARANVALVGLASLGLAAPLTSIALSRGATLAAAALGGGPGWRQART